MLLYDPILKLIVLRHLVSYHMICHRHFFTHNMQVGGIGDSGTRGVHDLLHELGIFMLHKGEVICELSQV